MIALLMGLGIRQTGTFQLPYSFNAPELATMVEIVDAPIIEMPPSKFSRVNRAGGVDGGKTRNGNQENDSGQGAAADAQNDIASDKSGWTQTKGPYGGTIISLHATPEGILFAGTAEGGIFRSTDGGGTWASASEGLRVYEDNMLPVIFALAQKGNTLYAGTGGDLFYSTNGGDSWQQLTHFQRDRGISGIAFIGDTIYIGRHTEEGVFFSNDNGKSWTPVGSGLAVREGPSLIASETILFAKTQRQLFRLKAGEKSWTKLIIKDPSKRDAVSDITKFVVSDEVVYAAADGGLFRSTDTGNLWRSIKPEAMQHFYGELAAVGNTVFYIGSGFADSRVFRSIDAGNSWTMSTTTSLTNQTILSIVALSEKTLYVGTTDGVFRSTDGGESWTQTNTGIINTGIEDLVFFRNALYTITGDGIVKSVDGGIVKSADGGNSWVPVNEGLVASDEGVLTVSGGKLYTATNETNYGLNPSTSGIYCLADDGNSWIPIQTNMESSNNRIYVVNQLAISGETFYIVGQMGGKEWLYRWKVGENLWTQLMPQDFFGWGNVSCVRQNGLHQCGAWKTVPFG